MVRMDEQSGLGGRILCGQPGSCPLLCPASRRHADQDFGQPGNDLFHRVSEYQLSERQGGSLQAQRRRQEEVRKTAHRHHQYYHVSKWGGYTL